MFPTVFYVNCVEGKEHNANYFNNSFILTTVNMCKSLTLNLNRLWLLYMYFTDDSQSNTKKFLRSLVILNAVRMAHDSTLKIGYDTFTGARDVGRTNNKNVESFNCHEPRF